MNLLTGQRMYRCKVIQITINQEVIDIFEAISKKYGIKYLLKPKDRKYGTIHEDDYEDDDGDASISGVGDEDEE